MGEQSVRSKKGEIEFRMRIYQQQVNGKRIFGDEFDAKEIENILRDRMKKTYNQMVSLRKRHIPLSPYVEIGAERCQRALVMENDLGANGAALDISFESLQSCDYYRNALHREKNPLRICCDAHELPFMTGSIPFVFCYQTLHHFPDPTPITREINRILSPGGYFYFDEEPYKKMVHLNLYKGEKIYSKAYNNRSRIRRIVDYFFSKLCCNETEYHIVENEDLSLNDWRKILGFFSEKQVDLHSILHIESQLANPRNYMKFLFANALGGTISGICRKPGASSRIDTRILDLIICPSCIEDGFESTLVDRGHYLSCNRCLKRFPIRDGVVFLFSYAKLKELYPGIFASLQK